MLSKLSKTIQKLLSEGMQLLHHFPIGQARLSATELGRERISDLLKSIEDSHTEGEIDEDTSNRMKSKYEKELRDLENG